jgi:hypothetical protein
MKKLLMMAGVITALGLAGPVGAVTEPVVVAPTQCKDMTFDHTITGGNAQVVDGTEGRDLIVVGNANRVDGRGGDDCIVADKGNSVRSGSGDDVVVVNGVSNKVWGGDGNDTLVALVGGSKLLGEGDDDFLSGKGNTAVDGGAGSDECYTDAKAGSQKNCELPVVTVLTKIGKALHLL